MAKKKLTKKEFKAKLVKLINRHKVVTVIFEEKYEGYNMFNVPYSHTDYRKRRLKKDGTCQVAYKGHAYTRFSGYSDSCFVADRPVNVSGTVERMIRHDGREIVPVEIRYKGKRIKL